MDKKGAKRRGLYGKRGAYRPKSYGVEYRTLSNFWVGHPALCDWAWRATAKAIDDAMTNRLNIDSYGKDIEFAIDGGDANAAWAMVTELGLETIHV
jgi:hypothetical protein